MRLVSDCVLIAGVFLEAAGSALAQDKPVQLSLFSPVQIVPENESVLAFRLSLLYGRNVNMTGLDWGLVTRTTGSFSGVQLGGVGLVDLDSEGLQANLVSVTGGSF